MTTQEIDSAERSAYDEIVQHVEKMLVLQKEHQSVRREIVRVDEEIDERVYVLYGLTEEEIKIIEGN